MTRERVNTIDLLRFFAALAVVFFHYTFRGYVADDMTTLPYPHLINFSKYGYLGVELFFMISGFVILKTAGSGSLRRFVISRIVRLYPAFWVCCSITFILILTIGAPRFSATFGQYAINMTMLSGFVNVTSMDGAYWSLFVEMRFYALVALVLIIGKIDKAQLLLVLWTLAVIALEIVPIGKLRYLLLADYAPFFISGAVFFLIWSQGLSTTKVAMLIATWGLAIYQSAGRLDGFERHYNTELSPVVIGVVITAFFGVMLAVSMRWTGYFGRRQWYAAGAVTYPLYLLHQNIGYMTFNKLYPDLNPHLIVWGTIVLMIAVAYAVHVLVENRFSLSLKNALNKAADASLRILLVISSRAKRAASEFRR